MGPAPGPVVDRIEARLVGRPVDRDPVGEVDPRTVAPASSARESRGDLDPRSLAPRDLPDLHLGEVLVPAEEERDVGILRLAPPLLDSGLEGVEVILGAGEALEGGTDAGVAQLVCPLALSGLETR